MTTKSIEPATEETKAERKYAVKTMYLALTESRDTIWNLGIFSTLEEAEKCARDDRNHLTHNERKHDTHHVQMVNTPDDVTDLDGYEKYIEENEPFVKDEWTVHTNDETDKLSRQLDYQKWYTPNDEQGCIDCLRTNWDEKMPESEVQAVFEGLKKQWLDEQSCNYVTFTVISECRMDGGYVPSCDGEYVRTKEIEEALKVYQSVSAGNNGTCATALLGSEQEEDPDQEYQDLDWQVICSTEKER